MKVLLSGAVEGNLETFYEQIKHVKPHWAVCAGDFGAFPDPQRMDRASKKHAGRDFAKAYVGSLILPAIPTLFIAGVHDDNRWLNHRQSVDNTEVLSNVHWLAQGYRTAIGFDEVIRVTGLGRAYSEATFDGEGSKRSHRHYTRRDVERACSSGPTDLLILYEYMDAPGVRNVIFATRPKLILTAEHPNRKVYTDVQGVPIVSLGRNEVQMVEWINNEFVW